jgi:acetate kinase
MQHTQAQIITPTLLASLKSKSDYDPEHLPKSIALIESFSQHFPSIVQIACFDTTFHTNMPNVAKLLPIPRRYFNLGLQRYGFHGLSYAYIIKTLQDVIGEQVVENSNIIMAHLGNGASITAVKDGKSVDTSMGFTPASGIPMSTRSGNIDPGIAWYLMHVAKLNPDQFNELINHQSGLLGISETTGNMRELLKLQSTDTRAAEAIELFCYEAKKQIGAYAAVLGGLNILVFSGGIGEHVPEVRSQICDGLEFLGIELCEIKNMNNSPIISTEKSKATVCVVPTNEQLMIARLMCHVLNDDVIS